LEKTLSGYQGTINFIKDDCTRWFEQTPIVENQTSSYQDHGKAKEERWIL
jgi:hypothetical protein